MGAERQLPVEGVTLRGPQFPVIPHDLGPLYLLTTQLVGEPFQFARVGYGDEITLHFGTIRESRSPKLKDRRYGTYVLSLRGSQWVYKSALTPALVRSGLPIDLHSGKFGPPLGKQEIEAGSLIEPGTRVINADPYLWVRVGGIGIHLLLSDGSVLSLIPEAAEPPDDSPYPELASWELLSPHGLVKTGPGPKWEFIPDLQAH